MINRSLQKRLLQVLGKFPVVAILGARQVGKTTLARNLTKSLKKPSVYIDLEKPSDYEKLNRAEYFLQGVADHCVIIDEVQRKPELFALLRALVDEYRKPARFLLLGSASPELVKGVTETLTGRIFYSHLHPIGLVEALPKYKLEKHWFRGGFPDALTARTDKDFADWMDAYISSYVKRELSSLFDTNLSSNIIQQFWMMLANANSGIWSAQDFARSVGVSAPTINRYLDFLEAAFLVTRLPAWHVNISKRVVKSPKIYISDSGLLHRLCRIGNMRQLRENVVIGSSWEGYVIQQVLQYKPDDVDAYHYRTHNKAEVDLVLVRGNKPIACIEIKVGNNPGITKGVYECIEDLKTAKNYIITPDSDTYKYDKNITVYGLYRFLMKELPKL